METLQKATIETLVTPLESIRVSSPDKTLGNVLSQGDSSHEAVIIFDGDSFLGLVSPQQALYANNFPYTTKVTSLLIRPPMITKKSKLYEVAEHMLSTRIYTLPVSDDGGTVTGVIHGKDMLRYSIENPDLHSVISSLIEQNKPITAHKNATVKDIYHLLKEKGISRVILVDDEGDLAGIVSRGDLMHAFLTPTPKERFPQEGSHIGFYSLAGEKKFRTDDPVLKYATTAVDSLLHTTPDTEVITRLVTSPFNSIVLVDIGRKPTGFLSVRDVLYTLSLFRPDEAVPLIMKKPSDFVTATELEMAEDHLTKFGKKVQKRMAIEKIEVATDEPKNVKKQTVEFNTTLILTPVAGKSIVAVTKQRNYLDSIQEATALIEKQRRRNGISKDESKHASL